MVCNVHEYTIKQCGYPASINDRCPTFVAERLYESVRMCYEADYAHSCVVVWADGGGLGACTLGPPTPQWLEFSVMDGRGHKTSDDDPMYDSGITRPESSWKTYVKYYHTFLMGQE